jgi:hypothetical protein
MLNIKIYYYTLPHYSRQLSHGLSSRTPNLPNRTIRHSRDNSRKRRRHRRGHGSLLRRLRVDSDIGGDDTSRRTREVVDSRYSARLNKGVVLLERLLLVEVGEWDALRVPLARRGVSHHIVESQTET